MSADPALLLATLEPADRVWVERKLEKLGFEPEELDCCPPMRLLVAMLATITCAEKKRAEKPAGPQTIAIVEAARSLGLNGESLLRTWHNWQRAAFERGKIFSQEDDAA
jgi:hypothetical protein